MKPDLNHKIRRLTLLWILLPIFSAWFFFESTKPHTCSIFTAVQSENVLFGDNFDYHQGDLVIGFYPASSEGYGSIHFGFKTGNGSNSGQSYSRAVNDQGLAWAVNSIPRGKLNPQPEKIYSHAEDNYFSTIIKQAATVEEAISLAKVFDFGDSLGVQIHVADASGDAVVIGPGRDGEITFTRKSIYDGYLLSTNFNLAIPEKGPVDFRYDTATTMLDELTDLQALTPEYAGEILNALHLRTLTTHTLFSNVIDLKNGEIYVYYISQYNEVVRLNIADELVKGYRVVDARDMFSASTAKAGDASYHSFEVRFTLVKIVVILAGLALILTGVVIVVKKFKRHQQAKTIQG